MEDQAIGLGTLIENTIKTFVKLVGDISSLASLEAQLAKKSLAIIIVLSIFAVFLTLAIWFGVQALLLWVLFIYFSLQMWLALSILILFNALLLFLAIVVIAKLKVNLSFPVTRKHLGSLTSI